MERQDQHVLGETSAGRACAGRLDASDAVYRMRPLPMVYLRSSGETGAGRGCRCGVRQQGFAFRQRGLQVPLGCVGSTRGPTAGCTSTRWRFAAAILSRTGGRCSRFTAARSLPRSGRARAVRQPGFEKAAQNPAQRVHGTARKAREDETRENQKSPCVTGAYGVFQHSAHVLSDPDGI